MGKKQHSKDRMYLTTKEWKEEWGGHKTKARVPYKRLPFFCCAITFTPFEDPVCTQDGTTYDIVNIVPYIQKHHKHPVTGQPLALKDLVKLNFHKNADGEYHDPVLNKVFTEHTHIVAIRTTGNVYSYEAVEELCIRPKNWKDLLTDEPFTRKDIIHIQDPLNIQGRAIEDFHHVRQGLAVEVPEEHVPENNLRNVTDDMRRALTAMQSSEAKEAFARGGGGARAEATRILAEALAEASRKPASKDGDGTSNNGGAEVGGGDWRLKAPESTQKAAVFRPGASTWNTDDLTQAETTNKKKKKSKTEAQDGPAGASSSISPQQWYEKHVRYVESSTTTGAMSRAFTSSALIPTTKNQRQLVRLDRNPDKKGYLRLHTSLGDLNIELHCDLAPRTCENFLGLCDMGYYNDTLFHRSIKNFMIQGGDPTGTGTGGESIYGKTFKDELDSRLLHSGRGVLSMANSGPHTNGSQFFILLKSAPHLNYKHSVFGRVVGGFDVLNLMEKVPTDSDDRPLQEITITGCTIFNNPYYEMEENEKKEKEKTAEEERKKEEDHPDNERGKWYSNPSENAAKAMGDAGGGGVGRYLSGVLDKRSEGAPAGPPTKKSKVNAGPTYGNFDSW